MCKLGEELNDFQISEMIREADKDGDGEIDFDEFVRMVTCWLKKTISKIFKHWRFLELCSNLSSNHVMNMNFQDKIKKSSVEHDFIVLYNESIAQLLPSKVHSSNFILEELSCCGNTSKDKNDATLS